MKNKGILLTALLLVIIIAMTACAHFIPEPPLAQATPAPAEDIPEIDMREDSIPPANEGSRTTYIINIAWGMADEIIITPGAMVIDFRFFALGFCDEDIYFYEGEILYSREELLPEAPFYANWQPDRGISFVDHHNRRRYFFIADYIDEGYITLVEFEPGVSIVSG
ncbi:MAG: hypothetical protein FWC73_01030 [Defluviitaleaceae bacterium]|nr:hypothetical protein [Defluviitaleaceae bacterium]